MAEHGFMTAFADHLSQGLDLGDESKNQDGTEINDTSPHKPKLQGKSIRLPEATRLDMAQRAVGLVLKQAEALVEGREWEAIYNY